MEKNWRINSPNFIHSYEIRFGPGKPGYEANCDRLFSVHIDYYTTCICHTGVQQGLVNFLNHPTGTNVSVLQVAVALKNLCRLLYCKMLPYYFPTCQ